MGDYPKIIKLIEAIASAWTKCLPSPYGTGEYSAVVDGSTDCNRFVQDVLHNAGDYHAMDGMMANEMVNFMSTRSNDWLEVAGDIAQSHANNGAIVIPGWMNPCGHGHVNIVRPGIPESSGSWGIMDLKVPKVANVGEPELCRWDRKASFAFGKDRIPKYYALKEMLT